MRPPGESAPHELDDGHLAQRHLGGDPQAFGALVDRYQTRLLTFVNRTIGDRERAENLVQEVFIRAFRHLHRFDRAKKFSTWIYGIASNVAKTELRGRLAGMLVLGLTACSAVAAREGGRDAGNAKLGDRALDRTLVAGTLIEATIEGSRSRPRSAPGRSLTATVSADVRNAHRWVVIPAGSAVGLRIAHWGPATDTRWADARITIEVLSVTVRGRLYSVREAVYQPGGEVLVVAPGTRILFVLSEGFTAAMSGPSSIPK